MCGIKAVAVLGAGTMGHSIAIALLQRMIPVSLVDVSGPALDSARKTISNYLEKRFKDGKLTVQESTDIYQCLDTFKEIDRGVEGVNLVIEAVPEIPNLKMQLFERLDRICPPEVVLATNTSGIPITSIAETTSHKERVIGTHFYMPAHLIPLVEVIKSKYTGEEAAGITVEFLRAVGKKPVLVNKDIPGFIGNRLQHAIAREAISLVQNGIASVHDVDTVARYTLGLRFPHTGPLEQRDLNGLDIHLAITEYLYSALENSTEPLAILKEKVAQGMLGVKSGRGFYNWEDCNKEELMDRKYELLVKVLELVDSFEGDSSK